MIEDRSEPFLGTVDSHGGTPDDNWVVTFWLNHSLVKFQIDTGAEVTVIPGGVFEKLSGANLQPSQRTLSGTSQRALPVIGQFTGKLALGDRTILQEMYVVEKLHKPLIGMPAIEALGLLARVRSVKQEKPIECLPQLFQGLGRMQGEKLGVISRIESPTDWCAGMVMVPKPNKHVRICVDLTKLNENVRRERHPLPAVEQTMAQIAGSKVLSKLDANSGFWQIPLSPESSPLTTFITPFGRYCFNRLPFGITSAPEHYQRRMAAIFQGLDGVVCLMDDVLVHGRTQQEHDERLHAVMAKLQESGVTLNRENVPSLNPK